MTRHHRCHCRRRHYRRRYRHHWATRFILKPLFWLVFLPVAILALCFA